MTIILESNELPDCPHPKPFTGEIITEDIIKKFIESSISQIKQPIVIFGANWCPDARLLEAVIQIPTIMNFLDIRANILKIDVGNYDINTELFKMFDSGIEDGIPRVFIMDREGKNLNLQVNDTMRRARELSTQDIFNYFQEFVNEVN